MNIFSNMGVTELIIILLLALVVVGPERLPEMGRKLGKVLRDVRKMYENLSRDLGPEIASIQQPIQELRESVESVRSIPQDMVKTVVKAADLDDTIAEMKGVQNSVAEAGRALSSVGKAVQNPVGAAIGTAKAALRPSVPPPQGAEVNAAAETEGGTAAVETEGGTAAAETEGVSPEGQAGE